MGHLSPMVAVVETIRKIAKEDLKEPVEFMLISSDSKFIDAIIKETQVPYKIIITGKLRRYGSIQNFIDIFKIPIGFLQSLYYVFFYMPDVIFSKGGSVSFPVVLAGWLYRVPIIIHESDSVAGLSNKILSKLAKRVAISFKEVEEYFNSKKVVFTGNPIRNLVEAGDTERAKKTFVLNKDKPVILIMGGSQGSRNINNLILEILPELLGKYQLIHQCGFYNYDEIKNKIEKMNIPNLEDYHLFPFFEERIADAYAVSDLIISRAGANTIAEIMAVGKPSILIPLSTAASDHQTKNAFVIAKTGAAVLLGENNLTPHLLLNDVNNLFSNHLKMIEMMRAAKQQSHPEAAHKIAEEIIKIVR